MANDKHRWVYKVPDHVSRVARSVSLFGIYAIVESQSRLIS